MLRMQSCSVVRLTGWQARRPSLRRCQACAETVTPAPQIVKTMGAGAAPGEPHADTLLLVWGDHGQTDAGDHGGGSPPEVGFSVSSFSADGELGNEGGTKWRLIR